MRHHRGLPRRMMTLPQSITCPLTTVDWRANIDHLGDLPQ
jgi:hypothetical protein